MKIPKARPVPPPEPSPVKDDNAYVKGESAINYTDLAKPATGKKSSLWLFIIILLVLAIIGGACYYFFFLHHGAL